ncbi:MAG: hypothetical protein B6D63_03580 [Candidatus Latescibacteria bacterium 4484_7]|nr:MAG: hypothetical protein B6D63_03580 [Candidatus Latescibacteria bacterium 4484_7]
MDRNKRVSTGIRGLDDILKGGLFAGRSYLLVGSSGTGKTIFSIQFLLEGARKGEKSVFISLAESLNNIRKDIEAFDWDTGGIVMREVLFAEGDRDDEVGEYSIFYPNEVENLSVWKEIYEIVREEKPDRLVIDSATQLRYISQDEFQFRKQILNFIRLLDKLHSTAILTFEPIELEQDISLSLEVDGIIRLRREISSGRIVELRSVEIEKLRGSGYMDALHPFRITDEGIVIFPHYIEKAEGNVPGAETLNSGIDGLDELLASGIESGTTTIISGPTGIGKTTLGMQFLVSAARSGKKGIFYTFEESVESIVKRCSSIGIDVERMIEKGTLIGVRVNPMELYPDEFSAMIKGDIEKKGCRVVMIDSLRGYQLAMEQFGSLAANIQNIVTYLNGKNVTTFVINEVESITGDLKLTELGVSYVMDNAILLRFAEVDGRIVRVIGSLKKRLSGFKPELREFEVTGKGLEVGKKIEGLEGVLRGVPERRIERGD